MTRSTKSSPKMRKSRMMRRVKEVLSINNSVQEYYNKPRSAQPGLFEDIEGKNEEEIERIFRERSYNQYSAENSCPSM